MPEYRTVVRFIQQAPDRHAGMVPISLDHPKYGLVVTFLHLRRVGQAPSGVRLCVDHQTDFVCQVELIPFGNAGDETNGVESHHLLVDQITPQEIGVVGHLQADGAAIAGVRTLQVDPLPIEAEVAILQPEVAESTANRMFVEVAAVLRVIERQAGCHAIEIRFVEVPEPMLVDLQSRLDQRVAQFQFRFKRGDSHRLSRCGRGNG